MRKTVETDDWDELQNKIKFLEDNNKRLKEILKIVLDQFDSYKLQPFYIKAREMIKDLT